MAKKRFFDKAASLDAGEVILKVYESVVEEPVHPSNAFTKREQGFEDEPLEIKVSTNEPSQADIVWAKANLTGYPRTFEGVSIEFLERLCRQGIAANFGVEGYARGFKFHAI